jgi:heat shock transcription factor
VVAHNVRSFPLTRRQLNNYGFRKVSTDRYEFGVTGFQRGAPELLKTLKRHDASRGAKKATSKAHQASAAHYDDEAQAPASPGALLEVGAYGGMQSEVDQLKRDRLLLLKEVMRLRESSAHAAEEMRGLSARLAQTESVQQQMLGFLQQHIAPTLINANSHRLQPRKRRHLLLPPSPGRDGDAMEFSLPSGPVQAPQAQPEFEDVFMPVDQPQLSLHELPEDGALATSYHRTRPAPVLPQVLSLPDASPPSAEGLEWSDLLYDAQAAVAASGSPEAPGLARMNSDDIHRILKEMQLDAFEPLPCVGEGAAA